MTPEEDNCGKQKMLNAKWIDRGGGDDVAVSPGRVRSSTEQSGAFKRYKE